MELIVRKALISDAEQLIEFVMEIGSETEIYIALKADEFKMTIEQEQKFIQNYIDSDNSIFMVAEINNKIIGTVECRGGKNNAFRHLGVLGISIRKNWRGKGIGTKMMQEILNWAKNSNIIKRLELFVFAKNKEAIHLYENFGFKLEGMRKMAVFRNNEYHDDLLMSLII